VNTSNLYYAKKNLRKILRQTNKYIKYTGNKQTEAVVLIYFCSLLNDSGIAVQKSTALNNLYAQQLKKIKAAISTLHEDIQYDLAKEMKALELHG
jgi:gas vesicle protein